MTKDKFDYLCDNFIEVENELDTMPQTYNIELNDCLEEALSEIESLKSQIPNEQCENLLNLCKDTVLETIVGQFGLASVLLDAKDGGNVTTIHNFKKGITSTEEDQKKYEKINEYDRKKMKYDKVDGKSFNEKRKEDFQNKEVIIDGYTGKKLAKDGTTHLDHIVSAKEIETNPALNLVATPEQRAKIATQEANLTYTSSKINTSARDDNKQEWCKKKDKKTGKTKVEKYEVDTELLKEKDSAARKKISADTSKLAAKKYTKELLETGGIDAVKSGAYVVLGFAVRDLTYTIFNQLNITFKEKGNESLKQIFIRFKNAINEDLIKIKNNWKGMLEAGIESAITSFLSNIVIFVVNLFATTLKKITAMIRAGFVSLCQAVKIMVKPPEDMPKEEVGFQAIKIITAGLIGSLSLGLSAAIEKLLQSIPGLQPIMMFPIPFSGQTVSDVIATVMSALVGGILTTIAIYFMDKFHINNKELGIKFKLVYATGIVPQYTLLRTYYGIKTGYEYIEYLNRESDEKIRNLLEDTKVRISSNKEKRKDIYESIISELNQGENYEQ